MVKSTTKQSNEFLDNLFGIEHYETTISDGKDSVSAKGLTPEKSQEKASDKWKNR
jgi:hypothetical protein